MTNDVDGAPVGSGPNLAAQAAVIFGCTAVLNQIGWIWRASLRSGDVPLLRDIVTDGPNVTAALLSLAAVLVMLASVPGSWSRQTVRAVKATSWLSCGANILMVCGDLWAVNTWSGHTSLGESGFGPLLTYLPAWSISVAVLMVVLNERRRPGPARTVDAAASVRIGNGDAEQVDDTIWQPPIT